MPKYLAVTEKELKVLEAWRINGTIALAAEELKIPPTTAYNRIIRLKWRYRRAREFIREVERWMAKLPGALE